VLDELRQEIDTCDSLIIQTVYRRFEVVARIAIYKKEHGLDVYHPDREEVVLRKIDTLLDTEEYRREIRELFQHILQLSRRIQFHEISKRDAET
jgi:monofunctional chorismate mutase